MNLVFGLILTILGVLFIVRPLIFVRWFWWGKWVNEGLIPIKSYKKYLFIAGVIMIGFGVFCLIQFFFFNVV